MSVSDPPISAGSSRSARLTATVASSWLRTLLTTCIGLVATPMLVSYLGKERFGVVQSAQQWFAYLEFFQFGLGSAIVVLLIRAATTGTPTDVAGTAWRGVREIGRQLGWIVPAAVAMTLIFPYTVDLSAELRAEFLWAAPAILFGVAMAPLTVFRSLLDARQQGYLVNAGSILQTLVVAGIGVALARNGFGLPGQFWAVALGVAASTGFCMHQSGALTSAFRKTSAIDVPRGELWRLQWPLMVAGIAYQINFMSDNLLAGIVIGIDEVAPLALTQRLAQVAMVVGSSINGHGIWAGLVDLRAKVGQSAYAERVAETSKLTVGVILLAIAPVVAVNRRFVGLWVGDAMYAGDAVTVLTAVQLAIFSYWCFFAGLIDCFGLTRSRVWVGVLGTVVKLALVVPFAAWFGLAGIPLATAASYFCVEAWFATWVLGKETQLDLNRVARGFARAATVGGGWMAACYAIGNRTEYTWNSWSGLFAEGAALGLCSIAIGWFLILTPNERSGWLDRLKRWFGR